MTLTPLLAAGQGGFNLEAHFGVFMFGWLLITLGGVPLALVLQAVFPRYLRRTSECLERGPWSSLLVGGLGVVILLLAWLVGQRSYGFGKTLGVLAEIGLGTVAVLGAAAVYRTLGSRMYFGMNSPRADQAFPSTLLGGGVLSLAVLSVLGALVYWAALAMGLGAGLIALLGRQPKPPVVNPIPPKLS
jgi:hypothetical protein